MTPSRNRTPPRVGVRNSALEDSACIVVLSDNNHSPFTIDTDDDDPDADDNDHYHSRAHELCSHKIILDR